MTTTYKAILEDGQTFYFKANMVEASAPLIVNFHDEDDDCWQVTPYQTADAGHSQMRAAELLAEHYAAGDDDCTDVSTVQEVS
jgi:hypothetical protein